MVETKKAIKIYKIISMLQFVLSTTNFSIEMKLKKWMDRKQFLIIYYII